MYVIYLDESGNPNGWNNNQDHFIIGGVAIHEEYITHLINVLDDIQREFFPEVSIPLKFHAVDIYNGRDRFRKLGDLTRQRILDAIYNASSLIQYPSTTLFATAIHISAVRNADQALRDTFEDVVQRVNGFLSHLRQQGNFHKGMLIIDRSQNTETRYRSVVTDFRTSDIHNSYMENVDIPYFNQSDETRMLQLADFVSYAVFRYYEREDDQFLNKILSRFYDGTNDSKPAGLKHIIRTSAACHCVACRWRQTAD